MKQKIKESSGNLEPNVKAHPPAVASGNLETSGETFPATAGCGAAPCSAGALVPRKLKVIQDGVEFGFLEYEKPPCGASFQRGYKCAEYLIKSAIKEGVDITDLEMWCIVPQ